MTSKFSCTRWSKKAKEAFVKSCTKGSRKMVCTAQADPYIGTWSGGCYVKDSKSKSKMREIGTHYYGHTAKEVREKIDKKLIAKLRSGTAKF